MGRLREARRERGLCGSSELGQAFTAVTCCFRIVEPNISYRNNWMDSDCDAAMENGGVEVSANNGGGSRDSASPAPAARDTSVCEECEDRRSIWDCTEGCGGVFCDVCFYALHRKGKRALHKPEKIERVEDVVPGGGKGLSGWIGPRLAGERKVANPDMYDR